MFRLWISHLQANINVRVTRCYAHFGIPSCKHDASMDVFYEPIHGRTTCQPVLTTFLQPRHIPTRGYIITQSSIPDDEHMVARNMLSNY